MRKLTILLPLFTALLLSGCSSASQDKVIASVNTSIIQGVASKPIQEAARKVTGSAEKDFARDLKNVFKNNDALLQDSQARAALVVDSATTDVQATNKKIDDKLTVFLQSPLPGTNKSPNDHFLDLTMALVCDVITERYEQAFNNFSPIPPSKAANDTKLDNATKSLPKTRQLDRGDKEPFLELLEQVKKAVWTDPNNPEQWLAVGATWCKAAKK